jgi:hypothetical protein
MDAVAPAQSCLTFWKADGDICRGEGDCPAGQGCRRRSDTAPHIILSLHYLPFSLGRAAEAAVAAAAGAVAAAAEAVAAAAEAVAAAAGAVAAVALGAAAAVAVIAVGAGFAATAVAF